MQRFHDVRARVAVAFCAGLLAGLLPVAAPAQTSPGPIRTLTYAFELRVVKPVVSLADKGVDPAGEMSPDDCGTGGMKISGRMNSAVAAGNGGIDFFQVDCSAGFGYAVSATDKPQLGAIRVAVERKQPDGAVILRVSEQSAASTTSPVTCVVYPSTALICDPNGPISLEEVTLVRYLAPNAVDPSMPNDRQWQLQDESPQSSFRATYAVLKNAGGVMTIGERRMATGEAGPGSTAASASTFTYDTARDLPTSIDETLVQKNTSKGKYLTNARETVFRLQPPDSR